MILNNYSIQLVYSIIIIICVHILADNIIIIISNSYDLTIIM